MTLEDLNDFLFHVHHCEIIALNYFKTVSRMAVFSNRETMLF